MLRRLFKFGQFRRARFGIYNAKPKDRHGGGGFGIGDEGDAEVENVEAVEVDLDDVEERDEEPEESEVEPVMLVGGFREVKSEGARLFLFESVNSAVSMINEKYYGLRHRDFGRNDLKTFADFKRALREPWQTGIEMLEQFVRQLEDSDLPQLKTHQRRVRFNEEDGDDLDYDRFRGGQTDFWRTSVREDNEGPTEITMFIDLTTSFYHTAENCMWRGAAAIALADLLETKGFRTEIWVVVGSRATGSTSLERMIEAVNLKRTSDPMDRSSLINAVSAWFYRLGMFALRDTIEVDKDGEKFAENHYCATPTPENLDQISRDQNRVYCSGVFSFHGALDMIREEMKKLIQH